MNETEQNSKQGAGEFRRLARAIRFALVAIVLGLSYFTLRGSFSIDAFSQIYADLLGGHPLPALTTFVVGARGLFMVVSVLVPLAAIATLFWSRLAASFYTLGVLGIVTLVELIVLYQGLSAPLFQIISGMSGDMPTSVQ